MTPSTPPQSHDEGAKEKKHTNSALLKWVGGEGLSKGTWIDLLQYSKLL